MKGHGAAATEENRHFPKCIMGSGVSLEDKQVKCMMEMKHVKKQFPTKPSVSCHILASSHECTTFPITMDCLAQSGLWLSHLSSGVECK